jgi:alpha-glucoside transport system permease protein
VAQEATAGGAAAIAAPPPQPRPRWGTRTLVLLFLLPAIIFLGALVVYPTIATLIRSLYSDSGGSFVGLHNYKEMFSADETLTAIKNNAIWVVVAPSIVTALGLVFAVLSERVRWTTAFKIVVFMPMAISMLAAGVIFRLVYQADPDQGLANAVAVGVHDLFSPSSQYNGALAREGAGLVTRHGAIVHRAPVPTGQSVLLPVVGLPPDKLPGDARPASQPATATATAITGTVWEDFSLGGGGRSGAIDPKERGLPGMTVQALTADGKVAASTGATSTGAFTLSGLRPGTSYTLRLAASNFAAPFNGVSWLGPSVITPAIIGAYVWMWAGFAMVLIAAGLASIPREALEAARVDGATEWQVFRRVTVPLLSPVLMVVLVTLMINVLKIFDLVFIIAPGSSQDDANVLALEMWRVSFGAQPEQGLGSALAIFLFLLVVPAMLFNIRRFRREQQ